MLNKAQRASLAKKTINTTIGHILDSNTRAREGAKSSELIHYVLNTNNLRTVPSLAEEANVNKLSTSTSKPETITINDIPNDQAEGASAEAPKSSMPEASPRISVIQSDTYDAVETLLKADPNPKHTSRIAALNMASSYSPGGGVLRGALAQEETLCVRSTLYPSLKPSFYRLPELCAIYTPDVLVFRDSDLKDLPNSEWFFTDVITIAALKQPELKFNGDRTKLVYEYEQDRELMVEKVRLIFQVMVEKGIKRIVAGALGCGAYRNPPEEVAKMFRKVILGDKKRRGVEGIDEVVFAIFDDGPNLKAFREVFSDVMTDRELAV